MSVILIGMPGIEKRLARYSQLFSRIGLAHEQRPLTTEELTAVLTRRWHTDGWPAVATGPPRASPSLPSPGSPAGTSPRPPLLSQVQRILQIDHLDAVTPEVVEAAREALLIGG